MELFKIAFLFHALRKHKHTIDVYFQRIFAQKHKQPKFLNKKFERTTLMKNLAIKLTNCYQRKSIIKSA